MNSPQSLGLTVLGASRPAPLKQLEVSWPRLPEAILRSLLGSGRCPSLLLLAAVQVDLVTAGGTLHMLLDPATQTHHVEHVTAGQLLADRHLVEADDAGRVCAGVGRLLPVQQVAGEADAWQALNLLDELARLHEHLNRLDKLDESVEGLAEEV